MGKGREKMNMIASSSYGASTVYNNPLKNTRYLETSLVSFKKSIVYKLLSFINIIIIIAYFVPNLIQKYFGIKINIFGFLLLLVVSILLQRMTRFRVVANLSTQEVENINKKIATGSEKQNNSPVYNDLSFKQIVFWIIVFIAFVAITIWLSMK